MTFHSQCLSSNFCSLKHKKSIFSSLSLSLICQKWTASVLSISWFLTLPTACWSHLTTVLFFFSDQKMKILFFFFFFLFFVNDEKFFGFFLHIVYVISEDQPESFILLFFIFFSFFFRHSICYSITVIAPTNIILLCRWWVLFCWHCLVSVCCCRRCFIDKRFICSSFASCFFFFFVSDLVLQSYRCYGINRLF